MFFTLGNVPTSHLHHPSVVQAKQRLADIDSQLAAAAQQAQAMSRKIKKALPALISQVAGQNPAVAAQMNAVIAGDQTAVAGLLNLVAGNSQFGQFVPIVQALLSDDKE